MACLLREMRVGLSQYEGKIFTENKVFPPVTPSAYNGDVILALRCLMLRQTKPSDWDQLMALQPVVERTVRPMHCLEADEKVAKILMYHCRVQKVLGVTFPEVMNLLKVIDFCSVWLPKRSVCLEDKQYSFVSAKYVFPMKVFVAEECSPNCNWSLRHSPKLEECSIRLRACIPIHPGQYITASFSGIAEYGATFSKRYEHCRFAYKCKCRRCTDPTEGGSFFSGVKCLACTDTQFGYLLPEDPSDFNCTWRCYNGACRATAPGSEITIEVDRIHAEIVKNSNSLQALLNVIKANEGVKLHRNHYLIVKATQQSIDLCWGVLQNSAMHHISLSLLDKAKALTEKMTNIYKSIRPWNSVENAKLIFHYQMLHGVSKVRELLRLFRQNRLAKLPVEDSLLWPNDFWDLIQVQRSALDILLGEPVGSIERQNGILMKGVLEDTESLLLSEHRNSKISYETLMGLQKVYARYCSRYLYPALPVFEDKELHELLLFTGSYCRDLRDGSHVAGIGWK